ncbi:MAG: hypothetical protein ACLR8L_06750, partial [Oscillospiraceae bacterium]
LTGILYRDGRLLPDTERHSTIWNWRRSKIMRRPVCAGQDAPPDDPEMKNPTQGLYWRRTAATTPPPAGQEYLSGKNTEKPGTRGGYVRMAAEWGNLCPVPAGKLYLSGGAPQDRMLPTTGFKKRRRRGTTMQDFRGSHRAARAAERSALGNAAALSHGKIFQAVHLRKTAASRSTANDLPGIGCASPPDTRRTTTNRSRRQHHVDGLVMRFKICAAIDKENRNDNFLITTPRGRVAHVSPAW